MNTKKELLIVEQTSVPVHISKNNSGDYILEGTFTEFEVRNNNNRVYLAEDFLKHVKTLQPKIKDRRLMGELDHPAGFEISLKNVSHVIESLTYNEKTKSVIGRICLLDTDAGKQAKALVDGKVPLHISSRAAGVVESDGTVRLKQLFTYDLVADPGFTNARLKRVNESLGFDNELVSFYEIETNESENVKNINPIIDNKNKDIEMSTTVTKEQLDLYTRDWKRDFTALKESVQKGSSDKEITNRLARLEAMTKQMSSTVSNLIKHNDHLVETLNTTETELNNTKSNQKQLETYTDTNIVTAIEELQEGMKMLNSTVSKLISHNDHIVENVEQTQKYMEYVAENVNKGFLYMDYLAENLQKSIEYADYLGENLAKSIEYTEYVGEKVEQTIEYAEHIAEHTEKVIDYANHIAENVNETQAKNVEYFNYMAEKLEQTIAFGEHIAEQTEQTQKYATYVAEGVNDVVKFAEHIAENTEQTQRYASYVAENTNNVILFAEQIAEGTKKAHDYLQYMGEHINEENGHTKSKNNFSNIDTTDIDSKLNQILESAAIQKNEFDKKNTFVSMLLEQQVSRFNKLNETEKNTVCEKFQTRLFSNKREAQTFFESILRGETDLVYIKNMPEKYRTLWDSLTEAQQNIIIGQAKYRVFESQEDINAFWKSRDLLKHQKQNLLTENTMITENNQTQIHDKKTNAMVSEIRRRFGK
jgi:methyl-accepting chemotaxis protein